MPRQISTPAAPKAIGPYSQAIRHGDLLFCSGQVPLDPSTGAVVEGDVAAQARQVLTNLKAVVEAGGSTMQNVVRTTVYLADMKDYPAVNAVYAEFFSGPVPPARAAVQVAGLPVNAQVEIDCIAACITE